MADDNNVFKAFTFEHFTPVLFLFFFFLFIIIFSKNKLTGLQQVKLGFIISLIPVLAVIARMIITIMDGTFSYREELPLHLCRLVAFMMPFIMLTKNRYWFGILYFLIVAGTLQALITPDLQLGFPHFSYFLYWILHGVLVALPFYVIYVYGFSINKNDLIRAIIAANLYLVIIHIINLLLGSNYFYTVHKPPIASILDYFGPWPWYILVGELIGLGFFIIVYLPFYISQKRTT